MKSKNPRSCAATKNARFLIRALLLGFFALDRQARAQYVLAPAPPAPDQTPPAVQQTSEMDVFATPPPTELQPFKWGAVTLRPHPFYQFLYADGIRPSTNQVVNTIIHTISPGALLEMGRHWTLDYAPLFTIYSNNQFSDTFGQEVRLTGGTVYKDWIFGLSQGYANNSTPLVETGTQTRRTIYATAASAGYDVNSKVSLNLSANQNIVSTDDFSSYNEWTTLNWLNYQFWPRLNAAVGVGGGYDDKSASPDMAFEQVQGRVNWRATDKISFQLHGGVEIRHFFSGGTNDLANPNLVNPVFGATIQYQMFEQTRISITGQRTVEASYMNDQVAENTVFSAKLDQRLLGKLFLDLGGGYQMVRYVSSLDTATSNRQDDYYFLNVQLSRTFLRRGRYGVIYQFSRDDSSLGEYRFSSHQVGFQIGFSY